MENSTPHQTSLAIVGRDLPTRDSFPVDARELHANLGRGEMFPHWIAREISRHGLIEGESYLLSTANRSDGKPGRGRQEYHLTQNAAKRIQIAARGEVGDAAREGAVRLHEHVEAHGKPAIDLRAAQLQRLMLELGAIVAEQTERIAELTPRAEIADRLTAADGDMSLSDAARSLGFGPRTFIARLAGEGILHGHRGDRRPRADLLKAGYFVVRSVVIGVDDEGGDILRGQTMVSPAGLGWLVGQYSKAVTRG